METKAPRQASLGIADLLRNDSGIDAKYRHTSKWITPGEPIETAGSILKWYRLAPQDDPVPDKIDHLARACLGKTALEARGFGFVILHRCGTGGFHFLIVNTWRGNNELWETVFFKEDDATADFDLWPRESQHKSAFCVWELAAVCHEAKAWDRFLRSNRDDDAAQLWLADRCAGLA